MKKKRNSRDTGGCDFDELDKGGKVENLGNASRPHRGSFGRCRKLMRPSAAPTPRFFRPTERALGPSSTPIKYYAIVRRPILESTLEGWGSLGAWGVY
jgi:hypothetical protein